MKLSTMTCIMCKVVKWPIIPLGILIPIVLLLLLSCSVVSDSVQPHRWQPTRLPRPWVSPGKNTGVGCHFPLQCMKVKSESEVAQSYLTLSDPMDCSPPDSSVHGIFQARVLEWGAISFFNSYRTGDKINIQNYQSAYHVKELKLQSMSFDQVLLTFCIVIRFYSFLQNNSCLRVILNFLLPMDNSI